MPSISQKSQNDEAVKPIMAKQRVQKFRRTDLQE